jgi:hypothetical protein
MGDSLTLLGHLEDVQSTGSDTYRARCPSHEGRSRSLSIKLVEDRLLVNCFSGCSAGEIVAAVGLKMSDLFDKTSNSDPAARQYRQHANARETLQAINIPIRAVMMAVEIQKDRPLTPDEHASFLRVSAAVNQALDTATNQGVLNVR